MKLINLITLLLFCGALQAGELNKRDGLSCFMMVQGQILSTDCENSDTPISSKSSDEIISLTSEVIDEVIDEEKTETFDTYKVPDYGMDGLNAWIAVDKEGNQLPGKNSKGEWNWGAGGLVGSSDVMRSDHFLGLLPTGYTFVVAERRNPVTGNVASGANTGKYKYDFSTKTWSTGMGGSRSKIINGNYSP
jgi:hypothetical protein